MANKQFLRMDYHMSYVYTCIYIHNICVFIYVYIYIYVFYTSIVKVVRTSIALPPMFGTLPPELAGANTASKSR